MTRILITVFIFLLTVANGHWAPEKEKEREKEEEEKDEIIESDIVRINNGMQVPFGRSTFLDPVKDLQLFVKKGDRCTIRVIQKEPLSQRVGRLSPVHFNCQFEPEDVQYTHFGSRIPHQDHIKLLIRYETEKDTFILPLLVRVQFFFDQREVVVRKMPLIVNQLLGTSNPIDESIIEFSYEKESQICETAILDELNGLPAYGRMNAGQQIGVMQDCRRFLKSGITYQHTFADSPNKDYIPMVVEIADKDDKLIKQEYFQIVVRIQDGQENSPPQPSFNALLLMDVSQFVMTAITPNVLAAEDTETSPERLVFNITLPLGLDEGEIVSTDDVTEPVTSFYQKDIEELKIAYKPPSSASAKQRVFQIEMEIIDGEGKVSDPFSLMIVVKPMNTFAPMATRNTGLTLVEGQSRKLKSSTCLQISDEDNLEDVTLTVLDGMKHGLLLVRGLPVKHFSSGDLDAGLVVYQHDGSDSYTDNIIFRLDDGRHRVEFLFPISIYPSDDEPPVLNINVGLNVRKGEDCEVDTRVLSATDIDSEDSEIRFYLNEPLSINDQFFLRQSVDEFLDFETNSSISLEDGGHRNEIIVTVWTQRDLVLNRLFYRYTGQHSVETITRRITLTVMDGQEPPNESKVQVLTVKIEPVDDILPEPYRGISLELFVEEFQITQISGKEFRYTDLDTNDHKLTYRITKKMYDTDFNNPMNAGRLIREDNEENEVDVFTQAEINHGRISYKPPPIEMGIVPRIIQFEFEVEDGNGNILADQIFRIFLNPVDNKPPVILNTGFHVFEHGTFNITSEILDANDPDTEKESIVFYVLETPKHGSLEMSGRRLDSGSLFTKEDVQSGRLSYVNGGEELTQDDLKLEVSDGVHRVPVPVQIHIRPIDDEIPKLRISSGKYGIYVTVLEGERSQMTTKHFSASDRDTDDLLITFLVTVPPRQGAIEVNGRFSDSFKQEDLQAGRVFYVHGGQELGKMESKDYFNLTVSDMSLDRKNERKNIEQFEVTLNLLPKDNSSPEVKVNRGLIVREAGKIFLTRDAIKIEDIDTEDWNIVCTIFVQTKHGYLENISPASGSEKSKAGLPITAFSSKDIADNNIAYVQSSHRGVEPTEDSLIFSCSDGIRTSSKVSLLITIEPGNDEPPQIQSKEFIVMEGMDLQIDSLTLNGFDLDVPENNLTFKILRKPRHGTVLTQLPTGSFETEEFTLEDVTIGSNIVYHHDDSETTRDELELELSDGFFKTKKRIMVVIIPTDDETPRLAKNNGLEISNGEKRTITNNELLAIDLDSPDGNLTYNIREIPKFGFLTISSLDDNDTFNLTLGSNFTQYNIDEGKINYVNFGGAGSKDSFKFDLTDGSNTLIDQSFWIQIEGLDAIYPDVINRGVQLSEGGKVVLTTDILSTSDINSADQYLKFTITRQPGRGHLENSDRPEMAVTSFTQMNLAENKIVYVHTSQEELKSDSFEFEVTDGRNSVFRTFRISINDVDNKKPILFLNRLTIREGGRKLITPFELKLEDEDTRENLLKIMITREPMHGKIINSEKGGNAPATTFTMTDLIENRISYLHDKSETNRDEIGFKVSDGTHRDFYLYPNLEKTTSDSQTLIIDILSVDNKSPYIVSNKGLTSIQTFKPGNRIGFQFEKESLMAKDEDTRHSQILYLVTKLPKHGCLVKKDKENSLKMIRNFTQYEIDNSEIRYILNANEKATMDSFQFTLIDTAKNSLTNQTFNLNWAWISFEHNSYIVNETDRYLRITLLRRGYLGDTSFVGLSIIDRTAIRGIDFGARSSQQVQFSPGQSETEFAVRILDDHIFENEEEFELVLSEPILAAIEENSRTLVIIRDREDESSLTIPLAEYFVEEDAGEIVIPIERKGDLSRETTVVCSTESGTAMGTTPFSISSYSDFLSRPESSSSLVRFLRNQRMSSQCRVTIIDDALQEDQEFFRIRLTLPSGAKIENNITRVHIKSDPKDVQYFAFANEEYKVDENKGFLEVVVLRFGSDLSQSASVTLQSKTIEPISAQVNSDYLAIGKSLLFEPWVERQTVKVSILDDVANPLLEGLETFQIFLRMPENALLGNPNYTTIIIDDTRNDAPTIQFENERYSVYENDSKINVRLTLRGDSQFETTVRCYTRQMTAIVDQDYEERANNDQSKIAFKPGEREKFCSVNIREDSFYEGNEEFKLVLSQPESSSPYGVKAFLGTKNESIINIDDRFDKPTIRLERTKFNVKEPTASEQSKVFEIPIVRSGDLSELSVIRVHTKDGSAKSGLDYIPLSKDLVFGVNISRMIADIVVLANEEKEHRKAFTLLLKADQNQLADLIDTKAVIFIQEVDVISDVTFPSKPIVVSLRDYDIISSNVKRPPIPGYPIICITACNPKHPDYSKTGPICGKESINDSLSEFRWKMGSPIDENGVGAQQLRDVEFKTFFTETHLITLDSIYFTSGARVQCAARAVNDEGDSGLEISSDIVAISTNEGLCSSRIEGAFGAEPFTAKMHYTGSEDSFHPNLLKLSVIIPHQDGMLPLISTRLLSNFEFILSEDGLRVGHHQCSNLLNFDEIRTRYGFLSSNDTSQNLNVVGESEPYQFSEQLRGEKSLRFYRNLDLEGCIWEFTSYYDMSELVNECGGEISTDGRVLNLVQSFVSVKVPLYVSYIFYSPVAIGGWQHSDLNSELRLTFVYNTAIQWQQGVGTSHDSQLQGKLFPTAMNIGKDGRLVVDFRTKARFNGLFVLDHENSLTTSMVMSSEETGLTFKLVQVRTEPTFNQPEQTWQIVSDFSVRDYSGLYYVKLIPCIVSNLVAYSLREKNPECTPKDPVTFDLQIRFEQVSDPVPTQFSLNTQFHLMRERNLWLSNGSMGFGQDSDSAFIPGDTVYGRIMVDPVQNLGQSFFMTIEKCFLCTGVDGHIPKYDPENKEFGCVAESKRLLHSIKIIDKGAPDTIQLRFQNVPFDAILAEEDKEDGVETLKNQPGSDGFKFRSDPLFQVSYGRQWFIHCIYTVRSRGNAARGIGKRSIRNYIASLEDEEEEFKRNRKERDVKEVDNKLAEAGDNGLGTNMHQIRLDYSRTSKSIWPDSKEEEESSVFDDDNRREVSWTTIFLTFSIFILVIAFIGILLVRKRIRRGRVLDGNGPPTVIVTRRNKTGKKPNCLVIVKGYNLAENTEV